MEFHELGSNLLEVFQEETLGIVEFKEVGRNLLEVLHEETLGIAEFYEVGKNFLGILHEVLVVVVLQVHSNLLQFRSLYEVVRKLRPGIHAVILRCRYWSDVLHFYFAFDIFCIYFLFILCTFLPYEIF